MFFNQTDPVLHKDWIFCIRENRRNIRTAAFLSDYGEKQRENSCGKRAILRNWPFQSDYTNKMEESDGVNETFGLVTEKTSRMGDQSISLFSVEREKIRITENKPREKRKNKLFSAGCRQDRVKNSDAYCGNLLRLFYFFMNIRLFGFNMILIGNEHIFKRFYAGIENVKS